MKKVIPVILAACLLSGALSGCSSKAEQPAPEAAPVEQENTSPDLEDFSATEGTWAGSDGTVLCMNGSGDFWMYPTSGDPFQGTLEAVQKYEGDDMLRYDLRSQTGEFLPGFYFDSDTAIHFGNGDEDVFERIGDFELLNGGESQDSTVPPVLMGGTRYTGMTPLEADNDYRGGYYYSDMTEDGLTVIVNCCFANTMDEGEEPEDYVARYVKDICDSEVSEYTCWQDEALTVQYTYPIYIVRFLAGTNEDTTQWDMLTFSTDTHTYAYAYATDADFVEEKEGLFEEDIAGLYLNEPE